MDTLTHRTGPQGLWTHMEIFFGLAFVGLRTPLDGDQKASIWFSLELKLIPHRLLKSRVPNLPIGSQHGTGSQHLKPKGIWYSRARSDLYPRLRGWECHANVYLFSAYFGGCVKITYKVWEVETLKTIRKVAVVDTLCPQVVSVKLFQKLSAGRKWKPVASGN